MATVLNLSIVSGIFLLIFGGSEVFHRKGLSPDITRKITHIGSGFAASLLPFFVSLEIAVMLGGLLTVILIISKKKNILNSIHSIQRKSAGDILFAPALTLAAIILWPISPILFQGVALILGFSDGLAGVIGKKFGRLTYSVTGTKTVEGSAVFFVVTSIILVGIFLSQKDLNFHIIPTILGISFLITLSEAFAGRGWDNLVVPAVSGILLYIIL